MWHKFVGTEMNISGYRQLHYHTLRRGCRHAIKGKRVREKESTQRPTAAAREERHLSSSWKSMKIKLKSSHAKRSKTWRNWGFSHAPLKTIEHYWTSVLLFFHGSCCAHLQSDGDPWHLRRELSAAKLPCHLCRFFSCRMVHIAAAKPWDPFPSSRFHFLGSPATTTVQRSSRSLTKTGELVVSTDLPSSQYK